MQLLRSNFQAGTQGLSVLTTPFNTVSINEVGQHLLKVNAGGCCYTADGARTVSAVEVFIGTTKLGDATRVTGAAVNSGDIGGVFAFQDTFYFAYDAPNTDNGLRVQVTYSGAINCPMFGWELYNDCAMADPFEAPTLATGATANPTVTCASFGAGDAVTGGVTIVNGGSCVAQDTATYTGPAWVGMTGRVSGANATDATLTWTRTGTYPWVASAMVLKPAAVGVELVPTPVTVPANFLGMHFHYWPQARPGNTVTTEPAYTYGVVRNLDYAPLSGSITSLIWSALNPTSVTTVADMYASAPSAWAAFDTYCAAHKAKGAKLYWQMYGTPAHAAGAQYQVADAYGIAAGAAPPDATKLALFLDALFQRAAANAIEISDIECWNEPGSALVTGVTISAVDATANTVSFSGWLGANRRCVFVTNGTAPGGLTNGAAYWTLAGSSPTSLSLTQGGAAIDITSIGTGTHQLHPINTQTADSDGSTAVTAVNATADTITFAPWRSAGVRVFVTSTGTLPGGITANQLYYTLDDGTTTRLSLTQGGAAIDITSAGSGTLALHMPTSWTGSWVELAAVQKIVYQKAKSYNAACNVWSPSFWNASSAAHYLESSDGSGGYAYQWCDGVAYHPYSATLGTAYEGANHDAILDIRAMRAMFTLAGRTMKLAASEWGFEPWNANALTYYLNKTDAEQADILKQLLTVHSALGVQRSIPYTADEGTSQAGLDGYIGTLGIAESAPKIAAMQWFQANVAGRTITSALYDAATGTVTSLTTVSTAPTITNVTNSGGQMIGSSQTATVTNAGATQGTSTLTLDGQAQVVTAWSDTSITYTVTAGANTAHAIGTATTLVLTTSAGSANTAVTLAQEDGYTAVILTSVGTTGVPATTPALAIGYQLRANNGVTPEVDGSLSWPSGTSSCQVGVWASGQGYGAAQTVYFGSGAPVANGDSITTAFNTAHTFDPRTNDSSPDSYTLSVSAVTQGTHGSVTFTATSITYTPTTGYSGADSFTYTISDAHAGSATATVNVTVQAAPNTLPSGANAAFTINEDASKTFAAADFGFTDPDSGDTLQAVRIDTLPSAGYLRLSGVSVTAGQVVPVANIGNLVFTPASNANGSPYATFTFSVQDSQGGYDATPNTITINVTPVNDAPVAVADAITVAFNTAYSFDPRTNDTDIDSGSLSVSAVTQGTHGSVAYTAASVTYTPTTGYSGADSFTYTVTDGALTATATVSVTVQTAGITLPAAVGDSFTTNEDTAYSGNLATNDTAGSQTPNTWTKLTDPAHGTVTVNTNGTFTYTPTANYNGLDSFTYRLADSIGNHSDAMVSVTVSAVNDAPVAVDDARSTAVNTPITFDPRTNDTDLEGNTLTVTAVTQGAHGTVSFTGTSVTYTPTTDYTGSDTFTYTISDGTTTDVGSVAMTITPASGGRWRMTDSGLAPLTIWRMTESGLVAV